MHLFVRIKNLLKMSLRTFSLLILNQIITNWKGVIFYNIKFLQETPGRLPPAAMAGQTAREKFFNRALAYFGALVYGNFCRTILIFLMLGATTLNNKELNNKDQNLCECLESLLFPIPAWFWLPIYSSVCKGGSRKRIIPVSSQR